MSVSNFSFSVFNFPFPVSSLSFCVCTGAEDAGETGDSSWERLLRSSIHYSVLRRRPHWPHHAAQRHTSSMRVTQQSDKSEKPRMIWLWDQWSSSLPPWPSGRGRRRGLTWTRGRPSWRWGPASRPSLGSAWPSTGLAGTADLFCWSGLHKMTTCNQAHPGEKVPHWQFLLTQSKCMFLFSGKVDSCKTLFSNSMTVTMFESRCLTGKNLELSIFHELMIQRQCHHFLDRKHPNSCCLWTDLSFSILSNKFSGRPDLYSHLPTILSQSMTCPPPFIFFGKTSLQASKLH